MNASPLVESIESGDGDGVAQQNIIAAPRKHHCPRCRKKTSLRYAARPNGSKGGAAKVNLQSHNPPGQQPNPLGEAQSAEDIAPGITKYSTASHGGYFLNPAANAQFQFSCRI